MNRPTDPALPEATPGDEGPLETRHFSAPSGRSGVRRAMSRLVHRMMWAVMGLTGPMITCRQLTEFLSRYVEGGLTPQEQKAFERHVGMCRGCRDYVDSYVRTIELEGAAFTDPEGPLPQDVPEELVQGILAARRAAG